MKTVYGSLLAGVLLLAAGQSAPKQVHYTDVGHSLQIIGRFGHPLGTYLKLDGMRVGEEMEPTKSGNGNFRIDKVNGKPLAGNITLWVEDLKDLRPGAKCQIAGYETGEMIGMPQEVINKLGGKGPQAAWQFAVEFKTVMVLKITQ